MCCCFLVLRLQNIYGLSDLFHKTSTKVLEKRTTIHVSMRVLHRRTFRRKILSTRHDMKNVLLLLPQFQFPTFV